MGVQRFRHPDEARDALRKDRGDLLARIRHVWSLAHRLVPPAVPRGVQRFRSVEDAEAERERRVTERARRLRADRTG